MEFLYQKPSQDRLIDSNIGSEVFFYFGNNETKRTTVGYITSHPVSTNGEKKREQNHAKYKLTTFFVGFYSFFCYFS